VCARCRATSSIVSPAPISSTLARARSANTCSASRTAANATDTLTVDFASGGFFALSGGVFFKPLAHGADVVVHAGTKYFSGHSDCLIGSITSADEQAAKAVFEALLQIGANVSADDAYLTLRGMRTLFLRLNAHQENGLALAKWLARRTEVEAVLHPAFKASPGHLTWKRDFTGASGLFGVVLKPRAKPATKAFFNALHHFGMGFSWGGFESLCIHVHPEKNRSATKWAKEGPVLRIHAGLEDIGDLIADMERAFAAMNAAKG